MAKETVNKSEKNMYRYGLQEKLCGMYEQSKQGKCFKHLMKLIVSEENIVLAYRNICKNKGSFTAGVDGKIITDIQKYPIQTVVQKVRNKLNYYQPKKVRRTYIDKGNGKQRPLGIPSIWDRLIQQCVLQILEPICEAKFHERSNGFRPYRSAQNAVAQCYKMVQLQNLHYVVDIDIKGFFDNINHANREHINSAAELENLIEKNGAKILEQQNSLNEITEMQSGIRDVISKSEFYFSNKDKRGDAMFTAKLAAAKETADKFNVSSLEDLSPLKERYGENIKSLSKLNAAMSELQKRQSGFLKLQETHQAITNGNYFNNLTEKQKVKKEQELK